MISKENFEYIKALENNISDLQYVIDTLVNDNIYTNDYELLLHNNALSGLDELLTYKVNKLNSLFKEL